MESSLHRQLKAIYAADEAKREVRIDGFRIDAVHRGCLIEVQHASLASIRSKIAKLLQTHRVKVVKPLIGRKHLIQLDRRGGNEVARRFSPKRESLIDLFHELVYFVQVFPHARLTLEVPIVHVEESRYPVQKRRLRSKGYKICDQKLVCVTDTFRLRSAEELLKRMPALPNVFDTSELAQHWDTHRWIAQRVAYCLRHWGVIEAVGKRRNSWVYESRTGL